MSNLVDRYLLFRIRTKRDPEAFARIYDRYVKALYRFTLLKLPTPEEAQDVTAETFTKAWNYLQTRQEVSHIRALLYRIARNLIADFYRERRSEPAGAVTFIHDDASTQAWEEASDRGRGGQFVEARAELALVIQSLERLKEDYRDVVMLRLVDGLSFEDIAGILEKTTGNVRVIYHRAMKTLKGLEH